MPFRECSIVDQRREFCRLARAPGANLRELCRRFGIVPTTAYKWLGRFEAQGKEERFHRTLKAEVLDGRSFADLTQAQRAFDAWREVYNARRPHEALGMDLPASRYRVSSRAMPERIAEPEYEPQAHVSKVFETGWFSFRGRAFACPSAFVGKRIALRQTAVEDVFDLCYRSQVLAQIDLRQDDGKPVHHVPEHPSTLSPVLTLPAASGGGSALRIRAEEERLRARPQPQAAEVS